MKVLRLCSVVGAGEKAHAVRSKKLIFWALCDTFPALYSERGAP